ncbi:MAG TPA: hypothetical protein VL832_22065 [Puia sp.]|nr:hypothetical protein [Puia sp.]
MQTRPMRGEMARPGRRWGKAMGTDGGELVAMGAGGGDEGGRWRCRRMTI